MDHEQGLPPAARDAVYATLSRDTSSQEWAVRYVWSRRPEAWVVVMRSEDESRGFRVVDEDGEWVVHEA